jgi:hypothetical protein
MNLSTLCAFRHGLASSNVDLTPVFQYFTVSDDPPQGRITLCLVVVMSLSTMALGNINSSVLKFARCIVYVLIEDNERESSNI